MTSKLLTSFNALGTLSDEEIAAIDATMREEHYKKGTVLLSDGQFSSNAFFVVEGVVRKYFLINGEEKTSDFFVEGQWVVSLINIQPALPSTYYLACATDCTLAIGDSLKGEALYKKYPNLETISRKLMEQVFRAQQEKIEAYVTDTPELRYRKLLQAGNDLLQKIPQYQIASYVGVTPESLSRIRKRIAQKG